MSQEKDEIENQMLAAAIRQSVAEHQEEGQHSYDPHHPAALEEHGLQLEDRLQERWWQQQQEQGASGQLTRLPVGFSQDALQARGAADSTTASAPALQDDSSTSPSGNCALRDLCLGQGRLIQQEPVCLVKVTREADGRMAFSLHEDGRQLLLKIRDDRPLKVVSVVGPRRSGKSFLMNMLLGVTSGGFKVAHGIDSCTYGVWLWGLEESDHFLLVLDTEGLYDMARGRSVTSDLFTIVALISSFLIYNLNRSINADAMDMLAVAGRLASSLADSVDGASSPSAIAENLPPVLLLVRDCNPATASFQGTVQSWLEQQLDTDDHCHVRILFQQAGLFAFALPFPTNVHGDITRTSLCAELLTPSFAEEFRKLVRTIHGHLRPKVVLCGSLTDRVQLTASSFATYVESVVNLANQANPEVPELYRAVEQSQKAKARRIGLSLYEDLTEEVERGLPMEIEGVATQVSQAYRVAIMQAMLAVPGHLKAAIRSELQAELDARIRRLHEHNGALSQQQCWHLWNRLWSGLQANIEGRQYGSVEAFLEAKEALIEQYLQDAKGPARESVLAESITMDALLHQVEGQLQLDAAERARLREEVQDEAEAAREIEMYRADEREEAILERQQATHISVHQAFRQQQEEEERVRAAGLKMQLVALSKQAELAEKSRQPELAAEDRRVQEVTRRNGERIRAERADRMQLEDEAEKEERQRIAEELKRVRQKRLKRVENLKKFCKKAGMVGLRLVGTILGAVVVSLVGL